MALLKSQIESLLFVANKPLTAKELADLLKIKSEEVEAAMQELSANYLSSESGLQVIKNNGKYQLVSSAENAAIVQEFIKDETSGELSRPSLEALTVIAYRGPIAKIDLDRIRGVNCSLIIRNLLIRGLIEEKADKEKKESFYNVTMDFIRYLGINQLEDLLDYERLHADDTIDKMLNRGEAVEEIVPGVQI
ncbi:SMC-Scp complex subunit ScpB [Candidatus Falkowbacteria bacterium CG10_big_fil_rev_8_21_14_0_10_39_9]|uniref:SMC-Scp complex subunit ScpB n=1 Tax=Candidatus Falkowbacteria bacterium CG10_big_fil_rev_8_21_14_0_10_39_9 TaxID=1974566 RepID=A0A2M6WNL8_9BACT|nr:MAG: SMC-Scp complex subunit ScpB [Candidatus Falkowbacteria bacterium CG10_big_fil_rev_8_21_14_0_10_39_9]